MLLFIALSTFGVFSQVRGDLVIPTLKPDPGRCEIDFSIRSDCANPIGGGCPEKCCKATTGPYRCYHAHDHVDTKVYIHMMPWFETKATNGGKWGQHYTMDKINPDIMNGTRRQIASKFYPLIDLYASGDPHVIDWQLGLMKMSGVTGVLIDWPGTLKVWDYPTNLANCEAIIKGTERVGLEFAIVYEDHNLGMAKDHQMFTIDNVEQGKLDMAYIRDNYFTKKNYIHINGAPLLLDFGPQTLNVGEQWDALFSVLPTKPAFLPLWNQKGQGGKSAKGEFAWIFSNYLQGLQNFYQFRHLPDGDIMFGCAYPGFDSAYTMGGWGGPTWVVPVGVKTFTETIDLAIKYNLEYIQVATWNDYGEGTMIEPTKEFGYSFLEVLQNRLHSKYTVTDLEKVTQNFHARKRFYDNSTMLAKLENEYFELIN